jgi:hypothetical protein
MGGDECLVLEAAVTCQSSIVTKAADAVFGELGTSNARWREDVSRNAKLWFLVVKSVAASCALFSPRDGGSDAIVHMRFNTRLSKETRPTQVSGLRWQPGATHQLYDAFPTT